MIYGENVPDPSGIHTLEDLVLALDKLRRRAARKGQVQLSVRDIASRTGRAPSTLDPYLRGKRMCPADVYEEILRALDIRVDQLRPWMNAWERIADSCSRRASAPQPAVHPGRRSEILPYSETFLYRPVGRKPDSAATISVVTGDLRRVTCADVWVNSENTDMRMSRFEEYSVSAIIRFEGAVHDGAGRVVEDRIADELTLKIGGRGPVAAGTAITTGAGELTARNGVRYVIHVAAVQGEAGEGYRQVADIGRCVTNALAEAERLASVDTVRSILFPLLGTGVAGGDLECTTRTMIGAALDHLVGRPGRVRMIYLLASTAAERDVCRRVLDASTLLETGPHFSTKEASTSRASARGQVP